MHWRRSTKECPPHPVTGESIAGFLSAAHQDDADPSDLYGGLSPDEYVDGHDASQWLEAGLQVSKSKAYNTRRCLILLIILAD